MKAARPGLAITTDMIVGFPDETEEDFQATIDTVERLQFDNVFVFRYSKRRNTPAAEVPGQLDESVKEQRNQRLLAAVVGSRQRVLCEGPSKNNAARLTGRTPHNKIVIFDGDPARLTGQLLDIQIEQSTGFTLFGTACLDG